VAMVPSHDAQDRKRTLRGRTILIERQTAQCRPARLPRTAPGWLPFAAIHQSSPFQYAKSLQRGV